MALLGHRFVDCQHNLLRSCSHHGRLTMMMPILSPPALRSPVCAVFASLAAMVFCPQRTLAQNAKSREDACPVNSSLKVKKSVRGNYSNEAMKKHVEGTVVMCVTVDANGRVTNVRVVSGPPELFQSSVGAAKQSLFEPPPNAPVKTRMEISYSMTGPCPEGEGSDVGDVRVTVGPNLDDHSSTSMKILGRLYQPLPPYPEEARSQRHRGQLYLQIEVTPDGKVSNVRIVMALGPLLDNLAVATVRKWRFRVSPANKPAFFPVTLSYRIPCLDHQ